MDSKGRRGAGSGGGATGGGTAGANAAKPVKRLGRGLSSLMGIEVPVEVPAPEAKGRAEAPATAQAATMGEYSPAVGPAAPTLSDFQSIEVGLVRVSPYQPRKVMDEGAIGRLAESIKRSGLMQPIVVRPRDGGVYELVAGERRWRAAQRAGLERIPALVRDMLNEQAAEWALVENVQREDLNAMERAWGLRNLAERFGLQQHELAERTGLERSTVANLIRLTDLEPEIAQLIAQGSLSAGHGKALMAMAGGEARIALAQRAVREGWTVRRLEEEASRGRVPTPKTGKEDQARYAVLRDLERQIGQNLGTKVTIRTDKTGKRGKMVIDFYGVDHFDGLLARLNIAAR